MMTLKEDLTGRTFGNLTVLRYVSKGRWLCQCTCGNQKIVAGHNLKIGTTKSCGCWRKKLLRETHLKHGGEGTRLFDIWTNMRRRCYNMKHHKYLNYGARGIKVCDEWLWGFIPFRNWALANGYNDSLSIDRIDVNDDYKPSNCRWVTAKQQARNRSNTKYVEYNGERHCRSEWKEILGNNWKVIINSSKV